MSVDIGERIRSLRTARGLSQEEVARRTGIGLKSYGDLERRRTRDPHYSTLRGVARALNVRVEELLEEPVPLDEAPREAGPAKPPEEPTPTQVLSGGGIQSGAIGGGFIYQPPTEEEWDAFVRELEALQHDIAAGEKSKGVAWDTVVGRINSFKHSAPRG
jgi:transcriptional regulator with XRE-family HTH domain